jgi:hypothetical protein
MKEWIADSYCKTTGESAICLAMRSVDTGRLAQCNDARCHGKRVFHLAATIRVMEKRFSI